MHARRLMKGGLGERFWSSSSVCVVISNLFVMSGIHAEGPRPKVEDPEFDLPKLSPWDVSIDLRAAGGYNDNITMGSVNPEGSPTLVTGVDLSVLRLPMDGTAFSFLFVGDDTRFLTGKRAQKEQTFFASAELRRDIHDTWQAGGAALYSYMDSPFDDPTTEATLGVVRAVGHGMNVKPFVGHELGAGLFLELAGDFSRQLFQSPLDNYWDLGTKVNLKRSLGRRSELSVQYSWLERAYDTREQATVDGSAIPGTGLDYSIQRLQVNWVQAFDGHRRWRLSLRGGAEVYRDNGSGYYDYNRYFASSTLRYVTGKWEFRVQGDFSAYDYAEQLTVAAPYEARKKLTVSGGGRVERSLSRKLKWYTEYSYERSLANQVIDEYVVNTVFSGLDWELP